MSGFNFTGSGKLVGVESFQTKAGGVIYTLIVETNDKYAPFTPIKLLGRLSGRIDEFRVGAQLRITGTVGGRKNNAKTWPDICAQTVDVLDAAPAQHKEREPGCDDDVDF